MELQVKKLKVENFSYLKEKLFPLSLSSPSRQRQITHSLQLKGRSMGTYFKMCWFKSTFENM